MNPPTKPGQRCRVIGGRMAFNGEGQGPNQGKEVITVFLHKEQAGTELENVWHCKAREGDTLQTYYGAGTEADFLECWLEVMDPIDPRQVFNCRCVELPAVIRDLAHPVEIKA